MILKKSLDKLCPALNFPATKTFKKKNLMSNTEKLSAFLADVPTKYKILYENVVFSCKFLSYFVWIPYKEES